MIDINVNLGVDNISEVSQTNINVNMVERGDMGPKGEPGKDGQPGRDGIDGKDGRDGHDFKYEDFTQDQLEALRGPKGDKGDDGQRGPQGPAGPKGEKGEGADVDLTPYAKTKDVEEMLKNFDGGKVKFVNELPEKGEENVLYLLIRGVDYKSLFIDIYTWISGKDESEFVKLNTYDNYDLDNDIYKILNNRHKTKTWSFISKDTNNAIEYALKPIKKIIDNNSIKQFRVLTQDEYEGLYADDKINDNNIFFIKE